MNDQPFGITDEDIRKFREKQATIGIHNRPIRDTKTTSFFEALMSDDADYIQHAMVDEDGLKLLRGSDV
ncbi:MAG: hypothetical protein FWC70_03690 [Defluviitaleaceae bacterium]|nr:hypothetical protein [Defluviitaleaceae bacterium]